MPEIVWQPIGPSTHRIPNEWMDMPELTTARCDCGKPIVKTVDDYGKPIWKHMTFSQIIFYRLFAPQRLGVVNKHTPISGRDNS